MSRTEAELLTSSVLFQLRHLLDNEYYYSRVSRCPISSQQGEDFLSVGTWGAKLEILYRGPYDHL